jgi:hypothetical protein
LSIPVQGISGDEACEQVVSAEHTTDSDSK